MQKNNIYKMQQYFFDYINTPDNEAKNKIIENCKQNLNSEILVINRLKNIIDNLNNNKNTLKSFINNVFDIENDLIRLDLIENLESQINNKTIYNMESIDIKLLTIISYHNLKKETINKDCEIINNLKIKCDNNQKELIAYKKDDTFFNNFLLEKVFGFERNELLIAYDGEEKFIISDNPLPETSINKIMKEESLCDTRDIQYFIERIIGENEDKNKYLQRIFLDLMTNQNYRILNKGLDVINSDLNQNEYYVLNGVTLKKKVAILSFLRNYYLEIEDILNLVYYNYELIINFLEKIECNLVYKQYLIENIKYINEQLKIKRSLDEIENGKDLNIDIDSINEKNSLFQNNLDTLSNSFNSNIKVLSKKGYTSIYVLVMGIILCGITIAYLMINL